MSKSDTYPYVGLRPFKSTESIKFFGRNKQTNELLQRLHEHRFLAVVGSSGCGKSSLLLAGLIPALKGGYLLRDSNEWMIAIMKPGQSPMFNLAHAILKGLGRKAGSEQVNELLKGINEKGINAIINLIAPYRIESNFNFFLLADQFEELFRFCKEQKDIGKQNEAIRFVNTLLELSSQTLIPFHVVLTMRSDFIGDCSQFYGLPEAMNKSQYLVPRLGRQQLKKVITGPAKLYGIKVNSFLTSKLLNRLGLVQDELPVLQHALMRMWDYEKNVDKSGDLDLKDFESIGGFEKALSNDANKALNELSEEEKLIAEQLFKALTDIDDNGRKIRRRVNLSELKGLTGLSKRTLLDIIDHFVKDRRSFLYVREIADTGDILIDISHESLIRQWDQLGEWVDEESETAKFYKRLAEACRQYNLEVKEKDLLTGSELDLALEWRDNYKPTAVWANRYKEGFEDSMGYLDESEAERKRLQVIDEKRTRKQKNTTKAIMALLVLIIVGGGIIFAITSHNTKTRIFHNEARAIVAQDPTQALLYATEALNRSGNMFYKTSEQDNFKNTAQTIYKNHSFYKIIAKSGDSMTIAISSDGSKKFVKVKDDSMGSKYQLIDSDTDIDHEFNLSAFEYAAFSKDGSELFVCCNNDPRSFSWGIMEKDSTLFARLESPNDRNIIFSPENDRVILNVAAMGPVILYSNNHSLNKVIPTDAIGGMTFMALDPAEKKLFISGGDRHELYDAQGAPLANSNIHPNQFSTMGEINTAAFSKDGQQILTGSASNSMATLWDLECNKITEFRGHDGLVNFVAFSPNNAHIITGSEDNRVILWNREGDIVQEFIGHQKPITSVEFSENGKAIITSSEDGTKRLWKLNNSVLNGYFATDKGVRSVSISPKGNLILGGLDDGDAVLWDPDGEKIKDFQGYYHNYQISPTAFSPDGSHIITGNKDLQMVLWTIVNNKVVDSATIVDSGQLKSVAFSKNGNYIVSGSRNGEVILRDLTGTIISHVKFPKSVNAVAFSPVANELVVAIATGNKCIIVNMEEMEARSIDEYLGHSDFVTSIAFSPDGEKIATASYDQKAILWDRHSKEYLDFIGHVDQVNAVDFSPEGNSIVTGSKDNTAILWDLQGNKKQIIVGHSNSITSVAFSPDGHKLITGSNDMSAIIWDIIPKLSLDDFLDSGAIQLKKVEVK